MRHSLASVMPSTVGGEIGFGELFPFLPNIAMDDNSIDLDSLSISDATVDTSQRRDVHIIRDTTRAKYGFTYRLHKVLGHIMIDSVQDNGPCDNLIFPGEILLAVNGFVVSTMEDTAEFCSSKYGEDAVFTVSPTERVAFVTKPTRVRGSGIGITFLGRRERDHALWSSHPATSIADLYGPALLSGQLDKGDHVRAINGVEVVDGREALELIEEAPAGFDVELLISNGFPTGLSSGHSPSHLSPSRRYASPVSVWEPTVCEHDPSTLDAKKRQHLAEPQQSSPNYKPNYKLMARMPDASVWSS